MRIIVLSTLFCGIFADVSHLPTINNQYKAPSSHYGLPPLPTATYGVPQGPVQTLSDFNRNYFAPATKFGLPDVHQNVDFLSGFSTTASPLIDAFGYSSTVSPNAFAGVYSTGAPNVEINGVSSTPSPSIDFGGFSSTTPTPIDFGVNYAGSLSSISAPQFSSDAAINSGAFLTGKTSAGDIGDAFGVTTNLEGDSDHQVDVQKHLYFFAAPEEPEEIQTRVNVPQAPAKKNVKIIFIKAPTYGISSRVQIPAQQQPEEKTLVYVLVKKPEAVANLEVQTPPPTAPAKPEVFFIKYKTKQEAEEAISKVQAQHGQGVPASNVLSSNNIVSEATPGNFLVSSTTASPLLGLGGFGSPVDFSARLSGVEGFPLGVSSTTFAPIAFGGFPGFGSEALVASREGDASLVTKTSEETPSEKTTSSTLNVGVVESSTIGAQEVNNTESVQEGLRASDVSQNLVENEPASIGGSLEGFSGFSSTPAPLTGSGLGFEGFSSTVAPLTGSGLGFEGFSSTVAPLTGSGLGFEGFSSTLSPLSAFGSTSEPLVKSFEHLGADSGFYQSSTVAPEPFKTYGVPNLKK